MSPRKQKDSLVQINEALELMAYQLIETKETIDKLAAQQMALTQPQESILARLKKVSGPHTPKRAARGTVEPIVVKVSEGEISNEDLEVQISALLTERPHTYGELAEATGVKYGRIGNTLQRLRRRKKQPAVNLGTARRALWWIPTHPHHPTK